ncbi:hypothetical protein CN221_01595 [Sinorhizobium meliloti]|nr:hypothetical protein CN221_01595 [Sinorhizobium meliloti]RVH57344.1 hypothetical protein CN209_30285 [Sinorhizobium meliloti]
MSGISESQWTQPDRERRGAPPSALPGISPARGEIGKMRAPRAFPAAGACANPDCCRQDQPRAEGNRDAGRCHFRSPPCGQGNRI